jgi:Secretion system C-terminal sorting domain
VKKGEPLASQYYGTYTFSTNGISAMTPGKYRTYIYYWQPGGKWELVQDYGFYENYAEIIVVGTVASTEKEDNNQYVIQVYPNPATQSFTLSFNAEERGDYKMELSNTLGQVMYSQTVADHQGIYTKQINAEQYSKGVYLMKVSSKAGAKVQKVVIE